MKIIRSYSRKLNLGNFQTLNHSSSLEYEASDIDIDDVSKIKQASKKLEDLCMEEVDGGIERSKRELLKEGIRATDKPQEEAQELNFKDVKLNGD